MGHPETDTEISQHRDVYEHFWPQIVDYTVEVAASKDALMGDLAALLRDARTCGFVPPRPPHTWSAEQAAPLVCPYCKEAWRGSAPGICPHCCWDVIPAPVPPPRLEAGSRPWPAAPGHPVVYLAEERPGDPDTSWAVRSTEPPEPELDPRYQGRRGS